MTGAWQAARVPSREPHGMALQLDDLGWVEYRRVALGQPRHRGRRCTADRMWTEYPYDTTTTTGKSIMLANIVVSGVTN